MNPQDDPEARIRALEPTELGYENRPHTAAPPTEQWPGQAGYGRSPYGQSTYGQSPYGADPYTTGYSAPYPSAPQRRPAIRPWMVFAAILLISVALAGAAAVFVMASGTSTPGVPAISGGGDVLTDEPGGPGLPTLIEPPGAQRPSNPIPEPGTTLTISGIGADKSVTCNDNVVIISGANNTVDITGHCTAVTVSGFDNGVTVESTREITVSGFDNTVTYRTGTPRVNESGNGNSINEG